ISRAMAVPLFSKPVIHARPKTLGKLRCVAVTPINVMSPVARWNVQAVSPIIGRIDDASHICDWVLFQVLFVDAHDIRGRCRLTLHEVVEFISVDIPLVFNLTDAHDDRFQKTVERHHNLTWTDLLEIPRSNSIFG